MEKQTTTINTENTLRNLEHELSHLTGAENILLFNLDFPNRKLRTEVIFEDGTKAELQINEIKNVFTKLKGMSEYLPGVSYFDELVVFPSEEELQSRHLSFPTPPALFISSTAYELFVWADLITVGGQHFNLSTIRMNSLFRPNLKQVLS